MATYFVSYPVDSWPFGYEDSVKEPIIGASYSQVYNDGSVDRDLFLCPLNMSEEYPDDARVLGGWSNDGSLLTALHDDFNIIRPIGNLDGAATDSLNLHHYQGHLQRAMQETPVEDTLPQFPADNQPIVLRIDRWYDETLGFEGWGWKATITFADPTRPPDARAIGVYNDQGVYQYTTGAFVLTETGLDENDDPIMEWQTHSPPGSATTTKEDLYFALLFGAAQEGRMVLTRESVEAYFWESDQVIPGGEDWVDSGEIVTGMAGTVTLVSDVTPFPVGTQVRIDGVEMTVTSIWADQGLVLDPYTASTTGVSIEVWQ